MPVVPALPLVPAAPGVPDFELLLQAPAKMAVNKTAPVEALP
jgi:hypothetical protein